MPSDPRFMGELGDGAQDMGVVLMERLVSREANLIEDCAVGMRANAKPPCAIKRGTRLQSMLNTWLQN